MFSLAVYHFQKVGVEEGGLQMLGRREMGILSLHKELTGNGRVTSGDLGNVITIIFPFLP